MGDTVIIKDDKSSDDNVIIRDQPKTLIVEEPQKVEKKVVTETRTTEIK